MKRLPRVGELVVFRPGTIYRNGTVGMVTKTKELKSGTRITVLTGGGGFSSELETKPIRELPDGWQVVNNAAAFEMLDGIELPDQELT